MQSFLCTETNASTLKPKTNKVEKGILRISRKIVELGCERRGKDVVDECVCTNGVAVVVMAKRNMCKGIYCELLWLSSHVIFHGIFFLVPHFAVQACGSKRFSSIHVFKCLSFASFTKILLLLLLLPTTVSFFLVSVWRR